MAKQLVGIDLGTYAFNAAARTITLSGLNPLVLEQILLVTNVTANLRLVWRLLLKKICKTFKVKIKDHSTLISSDIAKGFFDDLKIKCYQDVIWPSTEDLIRFANTDEVTIMYK